MNLNKAAEAVTNAFKAGVTPSEPTNTPVVLASQAEPEKRADHGEKDGDGKMPESNAFKSDRSRVLQEIAERRNAQATAESQETMRQTDEEGNDIESNPTPVPEAVADLEAAPQEQPAGSPPAEVANNPAVPAAPEETRTLIVDGQQVQVPVSKILQIGTQAMQKEVAADFRLKQATQILEEAKRVATQPAAPAAPAEPSVANMNDDQLAELLQFGTREQAASAIKALRSSGQQINPQEIVRAAQQAVAPQMAFEAAKSFAQTEYGDLLTDPDLGTIFLQRENVARANGDQRSYTDLYKAIGDDLRTKFNRPKPGATVGTPVTQQPSTQGRTMAEKQAAKAQAPAAPRLASARLDGDGTQPRAPTRSEIIDKQRRARGFQPYSAQK